MKIKKCAFIVCKNKCFFTFSTDLDNVILAKTTLYVLKNHKTEVLCDKPAGSPEPTITWLKADGQALPDKFSVQGCCTLQKDRIKMVDTGNYTCTAKNTFKTKSQTIQIIVSGELIFELCCTLLIMLFNLVLISFSLRMTIITCTVLLATNCTKLHNLPIRTHLVLLIMLYKVVLIYQSVYEILVNCDHSNDSY